MEFSIEPIMQMVKQFGTWLSGIISSDLGNTDIPVAYLIALGIFIYVMLNYKSDE